MITKICGKCKIEKSINDFSISKNNKDGKAGYCRECMSKYQKQYGKYTKELHNCAETLMAFRTLKHDIKKLK